MGMVPSANPETVARLKDELKAIQSELKVEGLRLHYSVVAADDSEHSYDTVTDMTQPFAAQITQILPFLVAAAFQNAAMAWQDSKRQSARQTASVRGGKEETLRFVVDDETTEYELYQAWFDSCRNVDPDKPMYGKLIKILYVTFNPVLEELLEDVKTHGIEGAESLVSKLFALVSITHHLSL